MVLLASLIVPLAACGSGGSGSTGSPSANGSVTSTSGVTVSGAYGTTPKVTIPSTAAPKKLTQQTLVQGTGATVAAGDTLVANYVGETWKSKKVFDSSFTRGEPAGFVIGENQVIPGWDKTLVGKKVGSRVLLTIPPADGYGSTGNPQAGISGSDTLVFVVDIVGTYKPTASAPGSVAGHLPASGWPKVTNVPAKQPAVTSVKGVKAPKAPVSKLLVKGSGAKIDPSKTLVLQLVQTDIATGKKTQTTWGKSPELVSASSVTQIVSALKGQSVGARAVALLPATKAVKATSTTQAEPAAPAEILVVDVVGQF